MGKKKLEDQPEPFISTKSLACRMLIGFLLLCTLGVACVLIGYYFGFSVASSQTKTVTDSEPVVFPEPEPGDFLIGVGRTDVTGPVAQVNMMGYANPSQTASGLHLRLYARAFVVADTGNRTRVAFVSVDQGMGSQIVKLEVIKKLQQKYGTMYTERNVVVSGTHSHSGPAGFFQTMLPEVTSLGAVKETTDTFINGIVDSISKAHSSMKVGKLHVGTDTVSQGNINRSPSAYLKDPESERSQYQYNTEQEMTLLKFASKSGEPIGMFTWFPVHGTSMNFSNELISSDNRGRASMLFEKMMRKSGENLTGSESFVGAFASANLGDVSPRTKGPICIDSGLPCDFEKSTCGHPARVQNCVGFGPGVDMFDSTDIIAKKQVATADRIFKKNNALLDGSVGWVHQYLDMSKAVVKKDDGTTVTTCKPGMGYSFAAGTTDGAGAFDFTQSMTEGTLFWDAIRDTVITKVVCSETPPDEYYECHQPKPVLLPTGYMDRPYAWHPTIIDVQMLKIGQLIIIAVPGEFTTMAGRRIKAAVKKQAQQYGLSNAEVVLAGLSNVYTHYITTPEEYTAQRYEGASTIYGPNTFTAYYQKFQDLVQPLVQGTQGKVDPGPQPDNILKKQIELLPPPSPDSVPLGKIFGDVITDVNSTYAPSDEVSVTFYGANPRHNMKVGSTYLAVQQLMNGSNWQTVYVDADWETKFIWADATAKRSSKTRNIITAILDVIEKILGLRFDYERAVQLAQDGNVDFKAVLREAMTETLSVKGRGNIVSKSGFQELFTVKENEVSSFVSTVESHITIVWYIPAQQPSGTYRIAYYADHVTESGTKFPFTGYSSQFQVKN